jgi:hypothetical protein
MGPHSVWHAVCVWGVDSEGSSHPKLKSPAPERGFWGPIDEDVPAEIPEL